MGLLHVMARLGRKVRRPAVRSKLLDPPAELETGPAPLERQRNSCSYRPASHEMSLMLAILYSKRSRTGFNKWV
jgi:hypothetical protein